MDEEITYTHSKASTAKDDEKRCISYVKKKKKILFLAAISVLVLLIVVPVVIASFRNESPKLDETERSDVVLSIEKSGNKEITHDDSIENSQLFPRQIDKNPSKMTKNKINENRLDGTVNFLHY